MRQGGFFCIMGSILRAKGGEGPEFLSAFAEDPGRARDEGERALRSFASGMFAPMLRGQVILRSEWLISPATMHPGFYK